MPLGLDYARQDCSLARALELVGERWTLLIVRDAFFGVRRFTDFEAHLDISKATLTQRLAQLVAGGLMSRVRSGGRDEYVLTDDAIDLWPAIFALTQWGERHAAPEGRRRIFAHSACGSEIDQRGHCPSCDSIPPPDELEMRPGPGARPNRDDRVSLALRGSRRLLDPVRS